MVVVTNNEPEEQPEKEYVAELIEESATAADQGFDKPASDEPISDEATLAEPTSEELATAPTAAVSSPAVVYSPTIAPKPSRQQPAAPAPAKPDEVLENLAAKGGAVGAVVLGTLALLGSFITSYAVLNAVIGLLMGLWGLNSSHPRMAGIGMVLCLISAFFCAVEISSWLPSLG